MSFGEVDWSTFRISAQIAVLATLLCIVVGTPLSWAMIC